MKNKKTLSKVTATAVLALLSSSLPLSLASPTAPQPSSSPASSAFRLSVSVEALRIHNLQAYAGKALNVFYVSAREAAFGFSGQALKIRAIKQGPIRVEISTSGEALIPAAQVSNAGFQTFNYIVIAVTDRSAVPLYLRNADGTYPEDARSPNYLSLNDQSFKTDRIGFMSMIHLSDLRQSRFSTSSRSESVEDPTAGPLVLDGMKDF